MVHSHRSSMTRLHTVLILGLVSLSTGVPHGRHRAEDVELSPASAHLAVEVEPEGAAEQVLKPLNGIDPSMVELTARGEMIRREVGTKAEMKSSDDPADISQDGAVTVVAPAQTKSEELKLEELTEECMMDEPTAECMEKFGSYGVRKMFTESFANIEKLEYTRPGWMSHPEVQKKKLFELTLPGTVSSGTYAIIGEDATAAGMQPYGIVSQNLNFYQQLELGVRLFDIRVAYSSEASLVYISHGALMIPLATALKDMQRFLQEHDREVIFLDVRKDDNADGLNLKPLLEEEASNTRVPGQLVHEAIACELKEMLVTYKTLAKLPGNEFAENPSVGALTDLGARVVYFWNSQQVLCTTFNECMQTPGWYPKDTQGGFLFAFGPPFVLGTRVNVTGGRDTARMIEPACHLHSGFYTKDDQPEHLIKKMQTFAEDMKSKTMETRPKCFPASGALPDIHEPTLWYTMDAFVTPTEEEEAAQSDRMRGVKAIYTRGEGFTVRTEAERTNYLVLSWFLKRSNQEQFTKPNGIMMEFAGAGAVSIIRIIEAQQGRPECGWAIYCKESGSCWADTLLGKEDTCLPEEQVLQKLKEHADGKTVKTKWFLYMTVCVCACMVLVFLCGGMSFYIKLLTKKKPKEAEQSLIGDQPDQIPDDVSEPDSVPSEPEERPVSAAEAAAAKGAGAAAAAADSDDDTAP